MAKLNELKYWKERKAVADRRYKPVEDRVKLAWEYYKGNQWNHFSADSGVKDRFPDQPIENLVFENVRIIVPRLNYRNPKVYVTPKKKPYQTPEGIYDTLTASAFFEILLTHYYSELQVQKESKKCLIDALLAPFAVMQLGYTVKTEKVQDDKLLDVNELIQEDSPFVMRRSLSDFRSDPEGMNPSLNDARWVAFRWVKSLEDVKKDPKYDNTAKLKPNYTVKTNFSSMALKDSEYESDDHRELWGRVEGWTIWDKKDHRVMDMVEGHDKWLRNGKEWPLDLEGFPCETLYFHENATDLFPVPDVWQYMPMQDELNRIISMQLSHLRRISERKYGYQEGGIDSTELRKLTNGGDGALISTQGKPGETIFPIPDATISQDIYINRQQQKKGIREMAGVSDTEALASTKFEQATEPALIEQAVQTIRGDQQAAFEDFTKRIIKKTGQILQQTQDELDIPLNNEQWTDAQVQSYIGHKVTKIAGPEGTQVMMPWLTMSKEDIKGEYDFDIEVGSTMPINEETRKRDAVTLYKILAENPYIRGREGTKEILTAFKKPDPDKYLYTEEEVTEQADQQAKKQLEFEQMKDLLKVQMDGQKTDKKVGAQKEATYIKAATDMAGHEATITEAKINAESKLKQALKTRRRD